LPVRFLDVGPVKLFNGSGIVSLPSGRIRGAGSGALGLGGKAAWVRFCYKVMTYAKDASRGKRTVAEVLLETAGTESDVFEAVGALAFSALDVPSLETLPVSEMAKVLNSPGTGAPVVPLGGWDFIFSEFEKIITEKGDVMKGVSVGNVVVEDSKALGLACDGEFIEADSVVLALPVKEAMKHVDASLINPDVKDRLEGVKSVCGLSLDLAVSARFDGDGSPVVTYDPVSMGMAVSKVAPATAPRSACLLNWYTVLPECEIGNEELLKSSKIRMKESIDLLYPELRGKSVFERWTTMDAVRNVPSNGASGESFRPDIFDVWNLYLLNDMVGGSGGAELKPKKLIDGIFDVVKMITT